MIAANERAKQEMKRMLSDNTDAPEKYLRLTFNDSGQLELVLDTEREGDQSIEFENSKLLLVSEVLDHTLQGITIDVEDTPDGAKLVLCDES